MISPGSSLKEKYSKNKLKKSSNNKGLDLPPLAVVPDFCPGILLCFQNTLAISKNFSHLNVTLEERLLGYAVVFEHILTGGTSSVLYLRGDVYGNCGAQNSDQAESV